MDYNIRLKMALTIILGLFLIIEFIVSLSLLHNESSKRIMAEARANDIEFRKKSSEVRLGQIAEQLAPFTNEFKHDPKRAHFIGQPIDYVVFEDDKIVFVEVKSGDSKLSSSQRNIRDIIKKGNIEFEILQIK